MKKLKGAFSLTVIEQVTQRTGEWAQKIDQTSRALGISREAFQAMQLLASKSNIPEDAVVGMFENIEKARKEALKGIGEYTQAFAKLGITSDQLRNLTPTAMSSLVMGKLPADIRGSGDATRNAVQSITGGTPENYISDIVGSLGGKSFAGKNGFIESSNESGEIVGESDIGSMSETWAETKKNLQAAAIAFVPIGKLLLGLANVITKALAGVGDIFGGLFDIVGGIFTGKMSVLTDGMDKVASVVMNAVFGFIKMFTSILDMASVAMVKMYNWIPGLTKSAPAHSYTKDIEKAQRFYNDELNVTKNEKRAEHGNALGEVAAILATGGAGAAADAVELTGNLAGRGIRAAKGALSRAPGEAAAEAASAAEKLKPLTGRAKLEADLARITPEADANAFAQTKGELPSMKDTGLDSLNKSQRAIVGKTFDRIQVAKAAASAAKYGAIAEAAVKTAVSTEQTIAAAKKNLKSGKEINEAKPIMPMAGQIQGAGSGEGSAMLKFGGVFGAGFENRMVRINLDMLGQLQLIAGYVRPERSARETSARGISGQAGGI